MQQQEEYVPPPVVTKPSLEVVKPITTRSPKHGPVNKGIVFDLETTGLSYYYDQITQIAATTVDGQKTFNVYILPKKPIPKNIVELTGLETRVQNGVKCMFSKGRRVESVSLPEGLASFIQFLKTQAESGTVTLIGHNCLKFDMSFLCEALIVNNLLEEFSAIVDAVTDSLYVLKEAMPNRTSYKQQDLVREGLKEEYAAHDALEDVKALAKLVSTIKKGYMQLHTYTLASVKDRVEYNKNRRMLLYSLYPLVNSDVISNPMAKHMADAGIGFKHLNEAYLHGHNDGLQQLLSPKSKMGRPRSVCDKQLRNALCQYFKEKREPPMPDADLLADELAALEL